MNNLVINRGQLVDNVNKIDKNFVIFLIFAFIVLCRPQDIFQPLSIIRPAFVFAAISFLAAIISGKLFSEPYLKNEIQVKMFVFLLFIMIIGIPTSLYSRQTFNYIFGSYSYAALFFILFFKFVDSIDKIKLILFVSCLGMGLYSVAALSLGTIEEGRIVFGKMFDANDLGYYAVGFLPLYIIFIINENNFVKKMLSVGCLLAQIILILSTGSRGGLVSLCIVVLLLIVRKTETIKLYQKILILLIVLLGSGFANINTERYQTIFSLDNDYNVQGEEGRLYLWKLGLGAMLEHPITGVGVSCFSTAIGLERKNEGSESQAWQTAHNSVIQIGTETGIIGLLLFLFLSTNALGIFNKVGKLSGSRDLRQIGEMCFVGFSGLFVSGLFLSQAYSIYWALYVSLSAVINQLLNKEMNKTNLVDYA